MALVSTRGPVYFPPLDHSAANGQAPTLATFALDAAAEKLAFIVTFWQPGTLHLVHFRTATVATGDTLKVSFQDIDGATGDPDGTGDEFRTIVVGNGDDNVALVTGILSSDGTDTGTKRTVVAGQMLAVVFEFNSFVAGNILLAARSAAAGPSSSGYTYSDHFTAAWAKSQNLPLMAIEYSDGSYAPLPYVDASVSGLAAETFNSTTTAGAGGDERGLIFQVPFACKVKGFWANLDIDNDAEVVLYDSDGTELDAVTLDATNRVVTHSQVYHVPFSDEFTLAKDTNYRLSLRPGAGNASVMVSSFPTAAVLDAMPGGSECHYTVRTDGGAWTETTTKRPLMGVILSAVDNGVSSGSGGSGAISRSYVRRLA